MDNKHCLREISVGIGITSSFAGTIEIFSRQSHSIVATLSFSLAATLALPLSGRQSVDFLIVFGTGALFMILFNCEMGFPKLSASLLRILDLPRSSADPSGADSERSEDAVSQFMAVSNPAPSPTLPLSASPSPPTPPTLSSPPTPSYSLSLSTYTLPPLPLPHPHPPTPSASPSPLHTLPLPHPLPLTTLTSHLPLSSPSPPTLLPLCLSSPPHTLPLLCLPSLPPPSASPSPPTPSHSLLPHHPHPPTPSALPHHPLLPLPCLPSTHTLPLPLLSHSPLPLPHHALSCIYWWLFLVVEFFTVLSLFLRHRGFHFKLDRNGKRGGMWTKREGDGDGRKRKMRKDEIPSLFTKPTRTALERWTRFLFAELREAAQAKRAACRQTDRTQTQSTSRLATSSPQSPRFWLDTHHIVAFAHSLCRYCLVSARAAGVNEIPVDLAVEAAPVDERVIEMKETGLLMNLAMKTTSSTDSPSPDCSAFLNWDGETFPSEDEQAVIFRSLVATVKFKPVLNDSLEAKSVRYLNSVLGRTTDESSTNFVQSIGVLLSTLSRVITTTAMEMLRYLFNHCSLKLRLTFVKADLIPQIINSLHPLSVSFVEAVNIHTCLLTVINQTVWLATQGRLAELKIEDGNEQQAVHETLCTKFSCLRRTGLEPNKGDQRQMWKIVSRMLRMEGMENVIEAKLENDKDMYGRSIVDKSIEWNNLLGMNLPGFGRNRRNKRTIKLVSAFFGKETLFFRGSFARRILDLFRSSADPSDTDSEGSEDTVAEFILRFFSLVFEFFPHLSSPPPTPTAFEGWTRFLFAEINRPCPNEQGNVQTDQQNSDTANLVACHVVSAVTTVLADTPHIVAFAHSMHRCCLVTPRTAGDTEVPVDASVESEIGTGGSEWRVESGDETKEELVVSPIDEMEDRD
ncbi:hypothetical protein BLNAU_25185 [Blattamonas nauphoetae]|uniref:Uncharacterized protein n=1 Tax=Blattamonas nauphoetae TaxID=2049346 RepID=A0ABQ9WKC1_9EUKA|nr:hypothetical protein BLNAU_25185 [Blattamonas nauphoetae]